MVKGKPSMLPQQGGQRRNQGRSYLTPPSTLLPYHQLVREQERRRNNTSSFPQLPMSVHDQTPVHQSNASFRRHRPVMNTASSFPDIVPSYSAPTYNPLSEQNHQKSSYHAPFHRHTNAMEGGAIMPLEDDQDDEFARHLDLYKSQPALPPLNESQEYQPASFYHDSLQNESYEELGGEGGEGDEELFYFGDGADQVSFPNTTSHQYHQQQPYQEPQLFFSLPSGPSVAVKNHSNQYPSGKYSGQQYHVSQTRAPSQANLRAVHSTIPPVFRPAFPFTHFNRVQSACFDAVYSSPENVVVSSPTGSGKTGVMELAIVRALGNVADPSNCKIVYIAPTKALCHERASDWKTKFGPLGFACSELTGDSDFAQVNDIRSSTIIVTTPEKWDATTRRWKDSSKLLSLVKLLLIDEVHSIKEPVRGATLEVVVSRMKLRIQSSLRILALSATCINIQDIGEFLSPSSNGKPAFVMSFGPEYRPVALETVVMSSPDTNSPFTFDKNLDYRLNQVIYDYAKGKPVLVFCSTRKSAIAAALQISKEMTYSPGQSIHPFVPDAQTYTNLCALQKKLTESNQPVLNGIAYHHGGLSFPDRHLIEESYLAGDLKIICTTSTLAVGVNLPAHLVIIKSTQHWIDGKWKEYPEMDILQMIGRAGRPQFDDTGVAVILTTESKRSGYQNMVSGTELIESTLHESLIEHLNAEIVLETITDAESAMRWLKASFLYVRIRQNPGYYKLKNCSSTEGKLSAEARLEAICLKDLDFLTEKGLITLTPDMRLQPTEMGKSIAKYYLRVPTGVAILSLESKCPVKKILEILCTASEFQDEVRFRMDKALLNTLAKSPGIRFKVAKIRTISQKVNVLLQCCLGSVPLTEGAASVAQWTLETTVILKASQRIIRCIVDYFVACQDGSSLLNALELQGSIAARCWEGSPFFAKQLDGIGPALAQSLASSGITSLQKLLEVDTGALEAACNRNPPFGNRLQTLARALPSFDMDISQSKEAHRPTEIQLSVRLRLTNPDTVGTFRAAKKSFHFAPRVSLVIMQSDAHLVYYESLTLHSLVQGDHVVQLRVTTLVNASQTLLVAVVSEGYVGVNISQTVIPEVSALAFKNERKRKGTTGRQSSALSVPDKAAEDPQDLLKLMDVGDDDFQFNDVDLSFSDFEEDDSVTMIEQGSGSKAVSTHPLETNRKAKHVASPVETSIAIPTTPALDMIQHFAYVPTSAVTLTPAVPSDTIICLSDSSDESTEEFPVYKKTSAAATPNLQRIDSTDDFEIPQPKVSRVSSGSSSAIADRHRVSRLDKSPLPAKGMAPSAQNTVKMSQNSVASHSVICTTPAQAVVSNLNGNKTADQERLVGDKELDIKRKVSSTIQSALDDLF